MSDEQEDKSKTPSRDRDETSQILDQLVKAIENSVDTPRFFLRGALYKANKHLNN